MAADHYGSRVFINCPFDGRYRPIFEATLFCVFDCGFRARCALEVEDSSQVRIDRILEVIADCKYGIHDLSRTELTPETELPRFNMPFELGLFIGAKRYGTGRQRQKQCLILDSQPYRYQSFLSDIAGQDIRPHHDDPRSAIAVVRNWLRTASGKSALPGGTEIFRRYQLFVDELPGLCSRLRLQPEELIYVDFLRVISLWLQANG
jgi:hypothetical protein